MDETIYKAVLNTITENVIVIDKNLTIIFQNRINEKLYGARLGENCYQVYRDRREPCTDCPILDVLADGKSRRSLRDVVLPNGSIHWIEMNSSPLRDGSGNIIGAVEAIHDVTEQIRLNEECHTLRREMQRQAQFENIVTQSKKMKAIFRLIERVAATNSTVLITGESGTGKELVARAILANSDRREKPFVSINCGAIPENLLESELFGHVKGAFTGAVKDHPGLIETCNGATLFLDEVGEIQPAIQVKLLRFLQSGEYRRVGDTKVRKVDVRILCATNRDLETAVKNGTFREDLFFRLSVIPISLPPLRERREDIPLLATHLFQRLSDAHHRHSSGIASPALKILMDYSWPGNVRELENAIEYAVHLTDDGKAIVPEHLPPKIVGAADIEPLSIQFLSIEDYTKQSIYALQVDHSEEQIAHKLGISRKNLWEKRNRWQILRPARWAVD